MVRLVNYMYVCTYITILSLRVSLLFEFISIFRNIIMDITRHWRMIKLIYRMTSCLNYVLANLYMACIHYVLLFSMHYEVCMNYALFCLCELWSLYGLCTRLFIWTMHFVVCIHVQIHVLFVISWAKYVNMFIS